MPNSSQSPSLSEMTCNGSLNNFVYYTFTTTPTGSTVNINLTDISCDISCGGSCGIQIALFQEPAGGACLGPGTWGPAVFCEASTTANQYYSWSGLQPSTQYYLVVDGNAGSDCVWNMQAFGAIQPPCTPFTPVITTNSPVCAGQSLQLSTSGGNTYAWTGPGSFTASHQSPDRDNTTTAHAGTYNVTVTDSAGCSGSGSTTVTVNTCSEICANGIDDDDDGLTDLADSDCECRN